MVKEDFEYYVSERIEACIRDLKKNNVNYQKQRDKYHTLYETLYNELEPTYSTKLDTLIDHLLNTVGMEREAIYITAIKDTKEIINYDLKHIK